MGDYDHCDPSEGDGSDCAPDEEELELQKIKEDNRRLRSFLGFLLFWWVTEPANHEN